MELRNMIYRGKVNYFDRITNLLSVVKFSAGEFGKQVIDVFERQTQGTRTETRHMISEIAEIVSDLKRLGFSIGIEKNEKIVLSILNKEIEYSMPKSLLSLRNLLSLVSLGTHFGFAVIESGVSPLRKYAQVSRDILTLYDGSKFYLELIDPYVIVETFFMEIHCQPLEAGDTVLDIGAAFGDTALYFARKGASVIAVEPINTDALLKNISLNVDISKRITTMDAAVGDGNVKKAYYLPSEFDGNAKLNEAPVDTARRAVKEVSTKTIEHLIDSCGKGSVKLLKMDCKGCESYLRIQDLCRVERFVEITTQRTQRIVDVIEQAGFFCVSTHYDPRDRARLPDQATIYGIRLASQDDRTRL